MKILTIPIDEIKENDYNPNEIQLDKFGVLVKNIKDEGIGYLQPILIDKNNTIIDGAHRYRACKEARYKKIQCVIFEGDEKKKKLLTLALNNLRGENDNQKLEALIADINKKFDAEKIAEITAIDNQILNNILNGPNFSPVDESEQPRLDEKKKVECPKCGEIFEPK